MGDILSVVRIKRDMKPPINETELMARLSNVDEQSAMSALMEHTMDKFISNHVIRITLPVGITAASKGGQSRSLSGNTLDINMSRALGEEGRTIFKYIRVYCARPQCENRKYHLSRPLYLCENMFSFS